MKALHFIITLCITSNFSLFSMGIKNYWPHSKGLIVYPRSIGVYCTEPLPWRWNNKNCAMINAYLLLSRRPQESVEQQIEFYEKDLLTTTEQLNVTTDFFQKEQLRKKNLFTQTAITQIQKANLSGNLQNKDIQEKLNTAFDGIVTPYSCIRNQELKSLY